MQKYELGRLLGQGTFGKVHFARSVQTGQSVAIKVRHPNIIHLHEVMATKTKIYFVMEYAKGGELFDKVAKGKLNEPVARKYFQQLINAVDFCHGRGVYHRDLKPENLLLDENENLKVSDFGLSALAESRRADGLLHTTCGTPAYVAPEVLERRGYNGTAADVWSCGVVLFVMLAGYLPFHDSNLMELYRKIGKAEYKFPRWFPPEVRRLISRILDPNPSTRITISRIRVCSWFRRGLVTNPETGGADNSCEVAPRLSDMNAFDIISLSDGFRLSRLFEEASCKKNECRFISWKPANVVVSKMEEIAKCMKMRLSKKDGGLFRLEGSKEGRKGVLCVDVEIFVLTPDVHLVEVRKSGGDTLDYERVLEEGIRPGLQDVDWSEVENEGPRERLSRREDDDPLEEQPMLQEQVT
ncbi:cbl-interacting serine/threonine-protein kinase 2 [Phtheirospermum japonicum]|uniref:non-specific serine/threonine protein kinase n=1 Tax=Phtheirospermum japonicum TaxID=374723 RepID=A0A830B6B4_9LAMI|nr:cbl-interacting serine/threonine-protein kinase 2 [Phtheirospermum japonicum]